MKQLGLAQSATTRRMGTRASWGRRFALILAVVAPGGTTTAGVRDIDRDAF